MTYYRALKGVQDALPSDAIIVSEVTAAVFFNTACASNFLSWKLITFILYIQGANTMDIGRTILDNKLPRHRLDAGTVPS